MIENDVFLINECINELKQNINLSDNALSVLESDANSFGTTETGLFNTVFKNFHQDAKASVNIRLANKQRELEEFYGDIEFKGIDSSLVEKLISKHLKLYEKELLTCLSSFPKQNSLKIRLDKDTIKLLRECSCASYFNKEQIDDYQTIYGDKRVGPYLKAIFEEYAEKKSFEREQIYFKEIIDDIKIALANEYQVRISQKIVDGANKVDGPAKFLVAPYKIVQDPEKLHNYLIGLGKRFGQEGESKPSCYRISKISKIFKETSSPYHISQREIKEIESKMAETGVMFLTDDIIPVKVEFTNWGLKRFSEHLHLRPNNWKEDENNPNIRTFQTTKTQAGMYFFSYGWNAKVLEPKDLVETLKKGFDRASQLYGGESREEIRKKEIK